MDTTSLHAKLKTTKTPRMKNLVERYTDIFKKIMLLVMSSSVVTSALSVHGLAYYQGYITAMGFPTALFPLEWNDAFMWTYHASRELGASTYVAVLQILSSWLFCFFLFLLMPLEVFIQYKERDQNIAGLKSDLARKLLDEGERKADSFSFSSFFQGLKNDGDDIDWDSSINI